MIVVAPFRRFLFLDRNYLGIFTLVLFILFAGCSRNKVVKFEDNQGNPRPVSGGDFMYFADAAVFRPCGEKKVYPVSHDGDYLELERKYLKKKEGGQWLYIEVLGHFEKQKNMEGKTVNTFVVEKILAIDDKRVCGEES